MSHTIHRYQLREGLTSLTLPEGFTPLHVAMQYGLPCMWGLHPNADGLPVNERTFAVYGTGFEINPDKNIHLGSVFNGPFVWHIFEVNYE